MANTIDQSFIKKFNTEVKLAYAHDSLLMGHVMKQNNVVGSTARFPKLGNLTTNSKGRNAALTIQDIEHTYVDVTLTDKYVTTMIDNLDVLKTNIDLQGNYTKKIGQALARECDSVIITAATAGSVTIPTVAGGLTMAKVIEIVTFFGNNKVPMADRNFVIGYTELAAALATQQFTSSDYLTGQAILKGEIKQAFGLNWIVVPDDYLPVNTNVASCFAYAKDALAVAVGQEPKTRIDYSPVHAADILNGSLSMGAIIVDAAGIVEVPCARA